MAKHKIINDPVYDGFLSIDDPVILAVIEHPYFQRQRRIKQLGLTHFVYPGAMHTRFSHMLGTLNLMARALETLRAKGVEISDEECRGAKLAILLHDIGHGPFSHTSERVLVDIHHEQLTQMMMHRMNTDHALDTAISIFNDTHPKHFLHQLVSSQLDMDRLDYLGRDSFFTGVSEGIVGTDRIISMLNVHDGQLVVDEKGIYSIEKFIVSRRLMYWQVYMHKTVIAADNLLLSTLRRASHILPANHPADQPLTQFLTHHYTYDDFLRDPSLLDQFAQLDDYDISVAIKHWTSHSDPVLSNLAGRLLRRQLPAITIANQPFAQERVGELRQQLIQKYGISHEDATYYVSTGTLQNHAYDIGDQEIRILYKNGNCVDISQASDQLDRHFLEKQVTKHFLYFPKELKQQ